MAVSLSALQTRAIVLDIEGTTTPLEFVHERLFPYARAHAAAFLNAEGSSAKCAAALDMLRAEQAADRVQGEQPPPQMRDYVLWLMDRDRKSPGLKALQGLIWQTGYATGALRGEVYRDVPPALHRWRAHGIAIYIYSSGSVLAQQLLFRSTPDGDLTGFLTGYFDTATGPKRAADSYRAIATGAGASPAQMLFVSDVVEELDAAMAAGLRTVLCLRGGAGGAAGSAHRCIRSFAEIGE